MATRDVLISLGAAILAAMALAESPAASQTTKAAANASWGQIVPVGSIVVELATSVDARKAKTGGKLEANLTMDVLSHGKIMIPRGTKILGHIIEARARTKQVPESRVEIAFDCLVLKNGREIPLNATIQAVGAPMQASAPALSDLGEQGQGQGVDEAPGPNEMKRIRTTNPDSLRPAYAGRSVEEQDGSGPNKNGPLLGPTSQGVVRMKGITLTDIARGSAISSTSRNVHLSSGTQLVLRVNE